MRGSKTRAPWQTTSDAITYPLCVLGIMPVVLGAREAGSVSAVLALLKANPMFGAPPPQTDGSWGSGCPLWTYYVGHVVGGLAVAVLVSAILVPWLEFANPVVRKALRGKRADVLGLFVTFTGLLGSAPLLGPLHKAFNEGLVGHFYHDTSLHGLPYFGLTLLLQLAVTETHFYWLHRAMHTSPWYELFHRSHHIFVPSIATASEAFHPIDLFLLAVGAMWLPLVIPVHHHAFNAILFLNAVWTVFQHAGSRTDVGVWWLTDANTHGIHHDYGKRPINCGSLTSFWDHVCGTYRHAVPSWAVTKWEGKGLPPAHGKKVDAPTNDASTDDAVVKSGIVKDVSEMAAPAPSVREWLCHGVFRWL